MIRHIFFSIAVLLYICTAAADVPISALPAASSVADSDITPIVQGGVTKKAAASLIRQTVIANITDSTTVGRALLGMANPSAIRFIRINADNTITARTAAEFLSDIGAQASGSYLVTSNNLSDVVSAATSRTNLGATTVGANLFTIVDPSAVRFIRVNADNTVSLLDAATFLSAIGGGTGGGSSIILDLADDGSNESAGVTEIAITGDTNSIFSEPSADKLLINVGTAWPLATNASFLDPDLNFVATTVSGAIAELDDVNGGGPNASDGKVDWSQVVNVPPGFSDGVDDAGGVGGGDVDAIHDNVAGEIAAITDKATPIITDHVIIEDSEAGNVKKDITVGSLETSLEGILDLQDMQGAILDGQVPNNITVDLATTATTLQTARTIGGVSFNGSADIVPMTSQVVDSTDATSSVAIFDSATGNLQSKTDAGLTYDSSTGSLSATTFSGPLSGNAATATVASTGDTATAFFSAGLLERTRGGTGADSSAMGVGLFGSDGSNNLVDVDSIGELETAVGGANILISTELDSITELNALVGVSLLTSTGNGSGLTGLTGTQIAFADTDDNWTATNIQAALEELDNVINGGLPNAAAGKVDWSQITNVPAGFADGADDSGAGGGDADAIHDNVAGEIAAIADKAVPVAADHLIIEDSDASSAKKDITIGSQESALEGVMDLENLQGSVTDAQVPNNITIDLATATTTIADGDKGDISISTGIWNIDGNVIGAAEIDENDSFDWTGTHVFDSDGLRIDDTNASHQLIITPGSDLSVNRIFQIVTGDSNRTFTLTGDASITGTNSGDVTLAGTPNYITLSGQVITRSLIDLTSHVTGDLPFANLTQGSALSVIGVAGNATADNASIAAALDGQALRRSGTAIGFGAIDLASANAVTGLLPDANIPNTITVDLATLASTVTVIDSTDATSSIAMFDSATGSLAAKTDAGLTYNASTGMLTATGFTGPLTGNASTATTLQTARNIGGVSFNGSAAIDPQTIQVVDSTDATSSIAMFDAATGTQQPKTDAGVTYNASTGMLTATGFTGPLTGNASTATTATTANAGDSATAFFTAGQIERARGGTGADTSTYGTGLLGSDVSNNTVDIDTIAEVSTALGTTGTPSSTTFLRGDNTWITPASSGDVTAAANFSVDNVLIKSDGTSKGVQATGITVDDSNNLSGLATVTATTTNTETFSILDAVNQSHGLGFVVSSDLIANKTFTYTGAFNFTMTLSADTSLTFPTSGTLLTTTGVGTGLTALNGENIQDDTIDDDSIDFGTGADQVSASDIPIADAGSDFTATEVEGALDEHQADIETLQSGKVATTTTLTVAGTTNEITSSAGAQDLSTNRTWTLSLPTALTFTGKTVTGGTFNATTLTGAGGGIGLTATGFNGNLTTTDDTLQEVAQKVDDLVLGGSSDIDALSAVTETALDIDDVFLVSVDGAESKITTDNFQDWLESLTLTFATMNVTTINATTLSILDNVDQSHSLSIAANENLTSNILLSLDLDGASRSLNIQGNVILPSGTALVAGGTLTGAGGGITLDASGFNGNLATTDNTLQEVAQKLDDLTAGGVTANSINGTHIALGSDAIGDMMYYNGTDWVRLVNSTTGTLLMATSGAAPAWIDYDTATRTLANKVLTAPKFADLGFIADASGNEMLVFDSIAGAVNHLQLRSSATTVGPILLAAGDDTNIDMIFGAKGTGLFKFISTNNVQTQLALYEDSDNGTDYLVLQSPASLASNATITLPATTGTLVISGGDVGAGTATTASANDNDTSIATTAYTQLELTAYASDTVAFTNKTLTDASNTLPCEFIISCSDLTTALTTGTTKAYFRAPYAFTVTSVSASVLTAPTGAILIVDINDGGTTIMTTNKLSIDATESTSITAATAAGITDTAIAADAVIAIDIDQIGSTVAGAGLIVTIQGTR